MRDTLAWAWQMISRHRLRSLLAVAGVGVGVCALTSIMSVEQAWRRAVAGFFAPMDLQTVRVALPAGGDWRELGYRRAALGRSDVEAIRRGCQPVESATLMTSSLMRAETGEGGSTELTVYGVDSDMARALPDRLREGRLLSAEETQTRAAVCVLSYAARLWLFGPEGKAIGRDVGLKGYRFTVVGVISGDRRADVASDAAYVPAAWSRLLVGLIPATIEVFVRTPDPAGVSAQIERLMRQRLGEGKAQPFTHSLWQVREAALNARTRATLYSGLAGLCALTAAGLGIAALLFVSVAERSCEIGIQRALGASRLRIQAEYLVAAALLSLGGTAVGGLAALPAAVTAALASRWQAALDPLAGQAVAAGMASLPKLADVAPAVSWEALLVTAALALITGLTAALAPASEAATVAPAAAIARRPVGEWRARKVLACLQVGFGVLVLVVLTAYFALLDSEQKAEARRLMGQDRLSAIADPVAAQRAPAEARYIEKCQDAFAQALATPEVLTKLRQRTSLLTALAPVCSLVLPVEDERGEKSPEDVSFTTAEGFEHDPPLAGQALPQVQAAFRKGEAVAVVTPEMQADPSAGEKGKGHVLRIAGKRFAIIGVRANPEGVTAQTRIWVPITYYRALEHRRLRYPTQTWASPGVFPRLDARPVDERRYLEATVQLRDALLPMLPAEYRQGIAFGEDIPETTKQFIFQHKAVAIRGAVGALAVLLVALIGLANMLLVSVHEELREVGVRRAFGALRGDIFWHFLSQGVLLSGLGAAAGLGLGALICWATRNWSGTPLVVSAFWAGAGAVATLVAGTITAAVPAFVGARVHPVEALRYE